MSKTTAMYPKNMLFTSEPVTEGHSDEFCDLISDAVMDECLKVDPASRVAWNAQTQRTICCRK